MLDSYFSILSLLKANNIHFVVTGTFGIYMQCPKFIEHYSLKDCDIFMENSPEQLTEVCALLIKNGWVVYLWDQPVELPLTEAMLSKKFYLRAKKEMLLLDITYDYETDIFGDMKLDSIEVDGFFVIEINKLVVGKKYRATENDIRAIEAYEKSINS